MNLLGWAITFLVIALIAAIFGFTGIASAAASIAKILFVIFLVLFIVLLIMNFTRKASWDRADLNARLQQSGLRCRSNGRKNT